MFGLCALMMCFFVAACGGKGGDSDKEKDEKDGQNLKSMVAELKNANDWDAAKFESFFKEVTQAEIDFLKDNPSEKELNEYDELADEFEKYIQSLDSDARKAFEIAVSHLIDDEKFIELNKELKDIESEVRSKFEGKIEKPLEEIRDTTSEDYDYYDEYPEYPDSLSY